MGLDCYLYKETYITFDEDENGKLIQPECKFIYNKVKNGWTEKIESKTFRPCYVVEEIGYWRKANHIHKWFVDNCGDGIDKCQRITVSYDDLLSLKEICETIVKQEEGWEEYAKENLPTTSGFFFGGTEYDEYYIDDCKHLINIVNELEKDEENSTHEYYYRASW